ncbi:MAG: sugar ABC transporter permease [Chloroflexi bacterium]|nr:sugar ABC transporter permease [Chloroflexota bacterium]
MTDQSISQNRSLPRPRRLNLATKQALFGYAILFPAIAVIAIFRFFPMIQAFYISLTSYDLLSPPVYIGLDNFVDLVQDPNFIHSVQVSVAYVVFSVVPMWVLSLGLAMLFNRGIRGKNLFRAAVFMPVVMPAVVNAVVWTFMYQQDGVVNTIIGWFGVDPIPWLRSSAWALWAVVIIGIWRATPYYMVIFLAGLQAIPEEYYEAAQIDGANGWAQFRHITLPLLQPTTMLVVVMSVIVALKVFAVPLIMTGGGPADATRVLPLFIYQTAFEFFKMGRAAAMSVFLFVAMLIFTIFQIRLFSRGED